MLMRRSLAEKFPEYQPVVSMAVHAHELDRIAEDDPDNPEKRVHAITGHEKVAAFLTPKLKAVEHTGADGGPFLVRQCPGDAEL